MENRFNLSETQIREIAFKAWLHNDPYPESVSRAKFDGWWEKNKGLYLSPSMLLQYEKPASLTHISTKIKTQRITS